MPPASPDPRELIHEILEPLTAEAERADALMAENTAFLEQRRSQGLDAETKQLLQDAARSPEAPASLRRLAGRVAHGEITWDDVFRGRAGADGADFLATAFTVARARFEDADMAPVEVPEEALEVGVDPTAVHDDITRTLEEARAEHDRIWREGLE